MKKRYLIAALILALAITVAPGCGNTDRAGGEDPHAPPSPVTDAELNTPGVS